MVSRCLFSFQFWANQRPTNIHTCLHTHTGKNTKSRKNRGEVGVKQVPKIAGVALNHWTGKSIRSGVKSVWDILSITSLDFDGQIVLSIETEYPWFNLQRVQILCKIFSFYKWKKLRIFKNWRLFYFWDKNLKF